MEQGKSKHRRTLSLTDPHAVGTVCLKVPLKYLHPDSIHGSYSSRKGKGHSQGLKISEVSMPAQSWATYFLKNEGTAAKLK